MMRTSGGLNARRLPCLPCLRHRQAAFALLLLLQTAAPSACVHAQAGGRAEDWTLTVETYHDMSLLGPHVQQKGTMKVVVHPPNAVRIRKRGERATVLYHYEKDSLVRREIDNESRTYGEVSVGEAIKRKGRVQREAGMPSDTEPPAVGLALALENGWKEVRRSGRASFRQYWLSGELVAAAALETEVPQPPAELVYAALCEIPVIHHYWVREALYEILTEGRLFFFEFFPRGPNYFSLWVTEYRKEAGSLPEEFFEVPEGYRERPAGAGGSTLSAWEPRQAGLQEDAVRSSRNEASSSRCEAKASGGIPSGVKKAAPSASEPGRGSPETSIRKPTTTTEP